MEEHLPELMLLIKIAVNDTGSGIIQEDLYRIFETFEQVDSSSDRRFQGTRLGLSLSCHLIERHQGEIWAQSPRPGEGSTFSFTLPL